MQGSLERYRNELSEGLQRLHDVLGGEAMSPEVQAVWHDVLAVVGAMAVDMRRLVGELTAHLQAETETLTALGVILDVARRQH